MRIRNQPSDSDVPFFPFKIQESKGDNGVFVTTNHRIEKPLRINKQGADLLRLADGETSLAAIVSKVIERYPDCGGASPVRPAVVDFLRELSEEELVWWRAVPMWPVPVGPPISIFLEITAACNLRCLHCVVGAGNQVAGELSAERWIEIARELADFRVQSVAFSGGEPLFCPHFRTVAEKCAEFGLLIQVSTNGTLVTGEVAHWLKDIDADVQVSLDGSSPAIHDRMRPGRQAFARALEGIRNLVAAGHEVTVGTVVSAINIDDIPNILRLTEELGVARFRLIPFVPRGRGERYKDMEIHPGEFRKITQYLHDFKRKAKFDIIGLEFEDMLGDSVCSESLDPMRKLGCGGGVTYATITPTGEVLPCHFFEGVRADSVALNSLQEVWRRSRFLTYFRHLNVADLHGSCRHCSWLPRCGGSCRAVNFSKGDLFGPNPQCWVAQDLETMPVIENELHHS